MVSVSYAKEKPQKKTSEKSNKKLSASSDYKTVNMLSVTKKGGYAALPDKAGDIFIQKSNLGGAMPADVVTVRLLKKTGRLPEGEVVKVVERNFVEFTGTFERRGVHGYVTPDSQVKEKIEVDKKSANAVRDGEKVFARMKRYSSKGKSGLAEIITSYGPAQSAAACCEAVLDRMHIRRKFADEILAEAAAVSKEFKVGPDRLDLRDRIIFTIDSDSAKDLDDAVSVEETQEGYRLGVHIADVSHYVRPGSLLDKEAFKRGTSIYYANSVIPMLPKELSNGLCSLNPGEDRLAFSAFMEFDGQGRMLGSSFAKSVIRSAVKGVYAQINRIFDGSADEAIQKKYETILPSLRLMRRLAGILQAARFGRGALDIDTDESEILIGEDGGASDILKRERGESERLIEEFMLSANEAVAKHAHTRNMPFVYRIHENPDPAKLEKLAIAVKAAGIAANVHAGMKPKEMAGVLTKITGTPKARALNDLVLRSLAKARYSPDCLGHYGLALTDYCHFTSPIRRYPDLAVHRILTDLLSQGADDQIVRRYKGFVADASEVSSQREVAAMQVEWACEAIYMAEYMAGHIGGRFSGVVSSVKSFGMYVQLDNTVEGLVRVDRLPGGWYDFDETTLSLFCQQTGMRFSIGDRVDVIVAKAEVATGQIDFELI